MRKKNCNVSTSDYNRFNISSTEVSLFDLKPYSVYEIRVCAQTSEARGKYVSIEIETNSSGKLSNKHDSFSL